VVGHRGCALYAAHNCATEEAALLIFCQIIGFGIPVRRVGSATDPIFSIEPSKS